MYARRLSGSLMLETCSFVAGIAASGIPNRRLRWLASMALETCLSRLAASLLTVMNMAVLLGWRLKNRQKISCIHRNCFFRKCIQVLFWLFEHCQSQNRMKFQCRAAYDWSYLLAAVANNSEGGLTSYCLEGNFNVRDFDVAIHWNCPTRRLELV